MNLHPSSRRPSGTVHGLLRAVAAALALCLAFAAPAPAQSFPELTGRVVDAAGILDPATEAAISERLAAFEQRSSDQIAVATVPSLEGYAIEDYANRLARQWALGREGEDNGVLLLVSQGDREVRIEVGYGLEGTLTDALSRIIIENDILPAFRNGDYSGGISAGVDGILAVLSGNAAELEARAERNEGWQSSDEDVFGLAFFGIVLLFVLGPFLFAFLARRFGSKVGPGRYRWMGMTTGGSARRRRRGGGFVFLPGGFGGSGGGSFGGGFSGGGGSFGGGGASGGW